MLRDPVTGRPLPDPPFVADAVECEGCRLRYALAEELRDEERRVPPKVFLRRRRPEDDE
ncbi:MAG TPA: hypothetical protein VGB14_00380 [Acidimicrobiales bacterium]|jgi:hypothetical protein